MHDNLSNSEQPGNLRDENEFLKLKLMLEHGADFGSTDEHTIPPEVENEFLRNVMAFEKQFEERRSVRVFDKIGGPKNFRPHTEISDENITEAWKELSEYLGKYDIGLSACSPNICARELYRFTTEELFEHEMDDIDMSGWVTHFIYDEFHPDLVFENTRLVRDSLEMIFSKVPLEWMHHFSKCEIRLNAHYPLHPDLFKKIISRFKESHDDLFLVSFRERGCTIEGDICVVKGNFEACGTSGNESISYSGNMEFTLKRDPQWEYWEIEDLQIPGIEF